MQYQQGERKSRLSTKKKTTRKVKIIIYEYFNRDLSDHETLMSYLSSLPTDASHKLTRLSEANHRY